MKHIKSYFLVVVLSLIPLVSFFATSLLPHTHDGPVHLARMAAYFKALQDGQIPVRWAGDLNYGYGLPLFNFIYPLPYTIASFFIFLGLGLVLSFKITLVFSFILSGIFMLGFSLEFFRNIKKAFLVTIFYQFFPFRIIEILVRGSFGEVYAYTFLPLVLWGITNLNKNPNYWNFLLTSIATALLIVSHNAVSFVFFTICLVFSVVFAAKAKNYVLNVFSLLVGLLLSSFYWIPAIIEHKFTYGDLFMKDLFRSHFPPIQNFFIPNFLNSESLQTGGISIQTGLFHTIAIILAIVALIVGKKIDKPTKKIFIFSFILLATALFLMQPISLFLWENISFLRQFQFSWRFLGVIAVVTSLLSLSFLSFKAFQKKRIFGLLIFLTIISTAYYWKPPLGFDSIEEQYYWNYPLNTTYFGETDVIWSAGGKSSYPKQRVEVIGGRAVIEDFKKKSNLHTFFVDAQSKAQLVDHTQYFPGWRAEVDKREVEVEFQDPNNRGEITFWVPKGEHFVKVVFGESPIRFFADLLSITSMLGLLLLVALRRRFIK